MKPRYRPRLRLNLPVNFTSGSQVGEGRVLDFTMPGCLVESPVVVQDGQSLQLEVDLPGQQFPLSVTLGVVRWRKGKRFGVEFIRMHESQQEILRRFMNKHFTDQSTKRTVST
jgi:PilZ domain